VLVSKVSCWATSYTPNLSLVLRCGYENNIEMSRHRFDTYLDNSSGTKDNRGVVVPGCTLCRVRLNTISQFVDHLTEQVERAIRIVAMDDPGQTVEAALCTEIGKAPWPMKEMTKDLADLIAEGFEEMVQ